MIIIIMTLRILSTLKQYKDNPNNFSIIKDYIIKQ